MPHNIQQQPTTSPLPSPSLEGPAKRDGYISGQAHRIELILGPTGCFRHHIEQYLATFALLNYQAKDLNTVRMSIGMFFQFVAQDQHLDDIDQVRPSTITSYIDRRRELGYSSFTFLGHLATFFAWLASRGVYDRGNPVIRRFHRERMSAPLPASVAEECEGQ